MAHNTAAVFLRRRLCGRGCRIIGNDARISACRAEHRNTGMHNSVIGNDEQLFFGYTQHRNTLGHCRFVRNRQGSFFRAWGVFANHQGGANGGFPYPPTDDGLCEHHAFVFVRPVSFNGRESRQLFRRPLFHNQPPGKRRQNIA